jgi:hypothetical protein
MAIGNIRGPSVRRSTTGSDSDAVGQPQFSRPQPCRPAESVLGPSLQDMLCKIIQQTQFIIASKDEKLMTESHNHDDNSFM